MKVKLVAVVVVSLFLIGPITCEDDATTTTTEPEIELDKKCKFELDLGNGTEEIVRFYFDREDNACKEFNWTGEAGNENNFETELDCLNDCFTGVQDEKPASPTEEDVVFVEHDDPLPELDCSAAKDSGKGKDETQRFYYNDQWHACFAFKFSGSGGNSNNFKSIDECEAACRHADGSVCTGPKGSVDFVKFGPTCDVAVCPKGSTCHQGMVPECCDDSEMKEIEAAYSQTCPDSTAAHGNVGEYFQAIFASACDDLICTGDQKCVQVTDSFAKCCGGEKRLADEIPVSAGALHVRIDDCQLEERLALQECEQFLTEIDIARRISTSKRMFAGTASILKEFNMACGKFQEYQTCVTLVTKNAGCLNRALATKEQLLNFVCQDNVRDSMSRESAECINTLSQSPKIKDCEDTMRRNLEELDGDICSVLDQTLGCTKSEILNCGRNTLSYVTNIVTTIKANIDNCSGRSRISGDSGSGQLVKTVIHRPSLVITQVTGGDSDSLHSPLGGIASSRGAQKRPSRRGKTGRALARKFPSLKPQCPPSITRQASSLCFPLLSARSVKQALSPRPGEFILTNFDSKNIEPFCEQSSRYRGCLENLYSSEDACLQNLKEDAFYSFIVAFEDKFCEREKQIEWLINSGCLKETTERLSVKHCLFRSGLGEDRALCKAKRQMTDCVMDSILTGCRAPEVKFFEKIYDGLHVRSSFCLPSPGPSIGEVASGEETEEDDVEQETTAGGGRSETTAIFSNECLRARQLALIRDESFVPECKETGVFQPMQCDRFNGSCFCVDSLTGVPFYGTASGPGSPLPLCGLKSLFTCERLPSKLFCEVDGTLAQKTERWYRRGDSCVLYLHDYCASQSHIPPIPLRTKNDCQRFCLPASG